jgi:hypothetical protein
VSVVLEAESIERLIQDIKADLDPTVNDPEYAFTQGTERPDTWTAGAWDGDATQSGSTWKARAITPLLGASGAEVQLVAGSWVPWLRLTISDEVVVTKLTKLTVRG